MKTRTIVLIVLGIITAALYILLASAISETYYIWLLTRILGLVSFVSLSTTLMLGELRMLTILKGNFKLFRFHIPSAIFSAYLIMLHGIAGISENYQWGKGVPFVKYLGFTFTDKWLLTLSLGTLAFYLIAIVSITSIRRITQMLGFKNWKRIHYSTYLAYIMAFIHALTLGTDLRTSFISPYVLVLFSLIFILAVSLLIVRVLDGLFAFGDQLEIKLIAYFVLLLIVSTVTNVAYYQHQSVDITSKSDKIKEIESSIKSIEPSITAAEKYVASLRKEMGVITNRKGA